MFLGISAESDDFQANVSQTDQFFGFEPIPRTTSVRALCCWKNNWVLERPPMLKSSRYRPEGTCGRAAFEAVLYLSIPTVCSSSPTLSKSSDVLCSLTISSHRRTSSYEFTRMAHSVLPIRCCKQGPSLRCCPGIPYTPYISKSRGIVSGTGASIHG